MHVASVKLEDGVRMGGGIVEEVVDAVLETGDSFGGFSGGYRAYWKEHGGVYCTDVIDEDANHFLYPFLIGRG